MGPSRRRPALSALLLVLAGLGAACATAREVPILATAQVAEDFATYRLRRVGLPPVAGERLDVEHGSELQESLFAELSRTTPYELVALLPEDLAEVLESEPHRRGRYAPRTVADVARRFDLDGVLFATVTHQRHFPPLQVSVQVDLVAAETGLVIWSGSVHLDATDPRVRRGLEVWGGGDVDGTWQVALLSPDRFARFAAWQIASLL